MADVSGRWGYSSGKAIILVHPSIPPRGTEVHSGGSGFLNELQGGTFFVPGPNGEKMDACAYIINTEGLDDGITWHFITGSSVDAVKNLQGPIYDVRNFEKVEDVSYYPSGQGGFAIQSIGFHYAETEV